MSFKVTHCLTVYWILVARGSRAAVAPLLHGWEHIGLLLIIVYASTHALCLASATAREILKWHCIVFVLQAQVGTPSVVRINTVIGAENLLGAQLECPIRLLF
jgi:hypothetical protein